MKQFKAESKKMLDLVINSIYTNKDVFLRELISNASDALDKVVLDSLEKGQETKPEDFEIGLSFDEDARSITVSDHGIGMTEAELEENLGTIAHSSSYDVKNNEEIPEDVDIIGQFGIGFYSVFMVADRVEVLTAVDDSGKAFKWTSDGVEGYTIEPAKRPERGTDVTLFLRPRTKAFDYDKFLSHPALEELVKRYSNFIRYPIVMEVSGKREVPKPEGATDWEPQFENFTERRVLNSMTPLWTKNRDEVSREEYDTFYMQEFDDPNPPLRTISMHARGVHSCDVLLFIPSEPTADFYSRDFKRGLKLYSSHVLIQELCPDLVPECFGFIRGIVDTPDIALNISRETLQEDPAFKEIAYQIEKRVRLELEIMKNADRQTYLDFFEKFGRIFKFAIYASLGAKNKVLADLLLFFTAQQDEPITLSEYKEKMPEGQQCIYYATGDDAARLEASPFVTAATEKGYDVLLGTESIDEFCFMTLREYEGFPLQNVATSGIEADSEKDRQLHELAEQHRDLLQTLLSFLKPEVVDITLTTRLGKTPACVTARGPISLSMERYFLSTGDVNGPKPQHVLELNPDSRIFKELVDAHKAGDKHRVENYARVLYDQSLLAEGLPLRDFEEYSRAVYELI